MATEDVVVVTVASDRRPFDAFRRGVRRARAHILIGPNPNRVGN